MIIHQMLHFFLASIGINRIKKMQVFDVLQIKVVKRSQQGHQHPWEREIILLKDTLLILLVQILMSMRSI